MAMDLDKEFRDLKRRVDLAETRLSQLEGQFTFIAGQLKDIQLFMHAKFDEIDRRFDRVEGKLDRLRDDLPDLIAAGLARGH